MMKKIRLIAIDLDGTLVRSDQTISSHTADIVIRAQQQGVKVAIVSGRPTFGAEPAARILELEKYGGYLVSYNGAEIYECTTKHMLHSATLPQDVLPIIHNTACEHNLALMTYIGKEVITERTNIDDEYIRYSSMRNKMPIRPVNNFMEKATQSIVKCIITGAPDKLASIEAELNKSLHGLADAFRSEPFFLEIVPCGINKAEGISRLLSATGISPDEVMAFGDGYNDIPMIEYAGFGVAMGNAQDAVKEKAQHVTLSNDEDGVAKAINTYVLSTSGCS